MPNIPINKGGTTSSGIGTSEPIRTVQELSVRMAQDPKFAKEMKKDPTGTIARVAGTPLETDVWIYRLVVGALGFTIILVIAGSIYLTAMGQGPEGRKVPEVLIAIGSAAVGALAGLLAPSPVRKSD
jgi:hypothetical protein